MVLEQSDHDTIVGVATGTPDGGVAVLRLSGSRSREIASGVLTGSWPEPRRLARRRLRVGGESHQLEDLLVAWMPGPASFTGEDVVELHAHGGVYNVESLVRVLVAAGARVALRGEFTRRAFVHGHLSLDQAEGLAAVVGARTELELRRGRRLLAGELGDEVVRLAGAIKALQVEVEAYLDFPDDVESGSLQGWGVRVQAMSAELQRWLDGADHRGADRGDFRVVIAGPANAGKSSLFNRLLGRDRALVSETPGTTRDYVEAQFRLGASRAVLVDTAGVRDTAGAIESAGIDYSREQCLGADLVLWVESSTECADEAADAARVDLERETESGDVEVIWVESKRDLSLRREQWLGVSAQTGGGLDALRETIELRHSQHLLAFDAAWVGLSRHTHAVNDTLNLLREAEELCGNPDVAIELLAFVLGAGRQRLGEITGHSGLGAVGDDVLDAIFSKFCIGK